MKWFLVIASAVLNGFLLHALWDYSRPIPVAAIATPSPSAIFSRPKPNELPQAELPNVSTNQSFPVSFSTWSEVAHTNFFQYRSNLVDLGCPPIITSLILESEVNHAYYFKNRALSDPFQNQFWDIVAHTNQLPFTEKWESLKKERIELLGSLFRTLPQSQTHNLQSFEEVASPQSVLKLQAIENDYEQKIKGLVAKVTVLQATNSTPEVEAERRQLKSQMTSLAAEMELKLQQALTPDEQREMELRNSNFAQQMAGLADFNATPAELIKMAELSLEAKRQALALNEARTTEEKSRDQDAFVQKQFDSAFQAALLTQFGQERLNQYKLAADPDYQNLSQWSRETQLPPETARQLYDEKKQALSIAARIRTSSLPPEEKESALREIRDALQTQIQTHMKPTDFSEFRKENKNWINALQ